MSHGGNRTVFSYIPFRDFTKKRYAKDVSLPLKITPILKSAKDNKLGALKHKQMEDNKNQRSETTRQLLERFFKPEFTPHLEKWMDRASNEEQKVILRLIQILHNKQKNDPRHKLEPIHIGHLGKIEEEGHLTSFPDIRKKETLPERLRTAQNSRRVHWSQSLRNETPGSSQSQRPTTSGSTIMVAELRTEFDIYPDWRAPLREVVPMTQVPYPDSRKKNRERRKLNFKPIQSDFVIHPEWFHP